MRPHILRMIHVGLIAAFVSSSLYIPQSQAIELALPIPGGMVNLSPAFTPAIARGMTIDVKNPFAFTFLIDRGESSITQDQKKESYTKLIKYFLAAMTIAEDKQWVNLSPYEKSRIIDNDFGKTEMGRDVLAQDYLLKQITSSLLYPEGAVGKEFWKRVYQQAAEKLGTTNIPVNTFNKVWITPDKASVYEKDRTVLIVESRLKVQLEEDYLALTRNSVGEDLVSSRFNGQTQGLPLRNTNNIGSQIMRDIVIPALTKEVNEGKNFANLRQMFHGMILATWYKQALKKSILTQVYANKNKVQGVNLANPIEAQQEVYQQYLKAFKKGVYNFIKEEPDLVTGQMIPRKYFSGGYTSFGINRAMIIATPAQTTQRFDAATISHLDAAQAVVVSTEGDLAMTTQVTHLTSISNVENVLRNGFYNLLNYKTFLTGQSSYSNYGDKDRVVLVFNAPSGLVAKDLDVYTLSPDSKVSEEEVRKVMGDEWVNTQKGFKSSPEFGRLPPGLINIPETIRRNEDLMKNGTLDSAAFERLKQLLGPDTDKDERAQDAAMNARRLNTEEVNQLMHSLGDSIPVRSRILENIRYASRADVLARATVLDGIKKGSILPLEYNNIKQFVYAERNSHIIIENQVELGNKPGQQSSIQIEYQHPIKIRLANEFEIRVVYDSNGKEYSIVDDHGGRILLHNGDSNEVTIGRNNWGPIRENDHISGSHVRIKMVGKQIIITDGGLQKASTNGSTVIFQEANKAMIQEGVDTKGGIDFNPTGFNLKRDGSGVPLPLSNQDPAMMNVQGLSPRIIEIRPAADLPIFRELRQSLH